MKVTLHLEGSKEDMANQCLEFVETLAGVAPAVGSAIPAKVGKVRPAKTAKQEEPETEEPEETTDEDDLGFEEEEEVAETTIDTVVAACRDFAKASEKNKEKVKKILGKLGVKSVRDIPKAKFDSVLKLLK